MMKKFVVPVVAVVALLFARSGELKAGFVYVGSWQVDDGPNWFPNGSQPILSAQQAAALLFGGSPSDYAISTVDANPANVNQMAWYSPWGGSSPGFTSQPNGDGNFPAGVLASESAFVDYGGIGVYDTPGDLSPYVTDWAVGSFYTNYAFLDVPNIAVPEPGSLALLSLGMASIGSFGWMKRRKAKAPAV